MPLLFIPTAIPSVIISRGCSSAAIFLSQSLPLRQPSLRSSAPQKQFSIFGAFLRLNEFGHEGQCPLERRLTRWSGRSEGPRHTPLRSSMQCGVTEASEGQPALLEFTAQRAYRRAKKSKRVTNCATGTAAYGSPAGVEIGVSLCKW